MRIQKIPLDQQLAKLRNGSPAHPEFNACAVRNMANIPAMAYLRDYGAEFVDLTFLLHIPADQEERITYGEVATIVSKLWEQTETRVTAAEAMELLALPLLISPPGLLIYMVISFSGSTRCK